MVTHRRLRTDTCAEGQSLPRRRYAHVLQIASNLRNSCQGRIKKQKKDHTGWSLFCLVTHRRLELRTP